MSPEQKKQQVEKGEEQPYTFNDEVTKNKIKKHIHDIKDVITEQDIANAKIPGEEEDLPPVKSEEDKDEKKKGGAPVEGKPITPWDVIE